MIEPYLRFEGQPGEQWTMFLRDPAGNALEFKAFADDGRRLRPLSDGAMTIIDFSPTIRDGLVTDPGLPAPVITEHLTGAPSPLRPDRSPPSIAWNLAWVSASSASAGPCQPTMPPPAHNRARCRSSES